MREKRCATCLHFDCLVRKTNPNNSDQVMELGDCRHPANEAATWTAAFGFERNGTDGCKWWEAK